mmetsp:Transcript_3014/g.8255  ORF Transcript_3014/g.8255 Transcript_3014/m.8255 type:complete len:84 (+) Transcript_3014:109-360(+)
MTSRSINNDANETNLVDSIARTISTRSSNGAAFDGFFNNAEYEGQRQRQRQQASLPVKFPFRSTPTRDVRGIDQYDACTRSTK